MTNYKNTEGSKTHSHSETSNHKPRVSPKKTIFWIIIGLIGIALIIGIVYFALQIFGEGNNSEHKNKNESKNKTQQHLPQTHKVKINVSSTEFNQNFMQSPNPEGYKGFKIGTSKSNIEKKFGKFEGIREINGNDAQQYGDIAISYNLEDKVDHVYVAPRQMTKKEFTKLYDEPDEIKGDIWYYNANYYNGFTIKVFTSQQYIKAIENVPQM
ncbi:zinc ribbon domain-containing protein [Staphylococcus condimenti]|uniref:Zinc ribbon domain-containing protein n=1 Tax=Staphylococcus condimenti TaxID=70255 RepID=A0A4Q7CN80_9STAP|nr:zinc ribbon domain-containing protein [Staphylococcus condimenti]RZI00029.1 zinc ribbon domain-containing protein [Staphylococcus condimenti]RZI01296.1 zinc ribbon domain-containing protein [Staphylococcus condimenti]